MAIALGGARFGSIAEMNVVPLIDILLVLLIVFMVIAPQTQYGLPVAVPQQADAGEPDPAGLIVVQVLGDGSLRVNREAVRWQDLRARLERILKTHAGRVAFVLGDDGLEFGAVARTVDALRDAGFSTVGLMTPALENDR